MAEAHRAPMSNNGRLPPAQRAARAWDGGARQLRRLPRLRPMYAAIRSLGQQRRDCSVERCWRWRDAGRQVREADGVVVLNEVVLTRCLSVAATTTAHGGNRPHPGTTARHGWAARLARHGGDAVSVSSWGTRRGRHRPRAAGDPARAPIASRAAAVLLDPTLRGRGRDGSRWPATSWTTHETSRSGRWRSPRTARSWQAAQHRLSLRGPAGARARRPRRPARDLHRAPKDRDQRTIVGTTTTTSRSRRGADRGGHPADAEGQAEHEPRGRDGSLRGWRSRARRVATVIVRRVYARPSRLRVWCNRKFRGSTSGSLRRAHGDETERGSLTATRIVALTKRHRCSEWLPVEGGPSPSRGAKGATLDARGQAFLDFNSQLMCTNIAKHTQGRRRDPATGGARRTQPVHGTEPRARWGGSLPKLTPGDIDTFFSQRRCTRRTRTRSSSPNGHWPPQDPGPLHARTTGAPRARSASPAIRDGGQPSRASGVVR